VKQITLSTGRQFKIASLSMSQTRQLVFSDKPKNQDEQMRNAFQVIACAINNANYETLPWYRKIFTRKVSGDKIDKTISLIEFRELQYQVLAISGLAVSKGEQVATA
jgi:hypothetical protein